MNFAKERVAMRTGLLLTAVTISPFCVVPIRAGSKRMCRQSLLFSARITYVDGNTHAGQPCQIGFGLTGTDIEALRIVVRPSHGIVGASAKEANRRYIAYAPSVGFVGHDRFELHVQFTPVGGRPSTTRVKVEMIVTP